jgi:hypothetical protein
MIRIGRQKVRWSTSKTRVMNVRGITLVNDVPMPHARLLFLLHRLTSPKPCSADQCVFAHWRDDQETDNARYVPHTRRLPLAASELRVTELRTAGQVRCGRVPRHERDGGGV